MAATRFFLMLDLECTRVSAEAYLNGIPVARVDQSARQTPRIFRPIHEYVVPGATNTLTLAVAHGSRPSNSLESRGLCQAPSEANVRLAVSILPEGAYYDDPGVRQVSEIRWQTPAGPGFAAPVILTQPVDIPNLGYGHAKRTWAEGAVIAPANLRDDITPVLRYLRDSLAKGDPEKYIEMAQPRFQDIATAYGRPAGEIVNELREQVRRVHGEGDFDLEEIRADNMDPRLCAGGRLVECVDANWLPTLRTKPLSTGSMRLRFSTFLANIGGQWRIVL